MSDEEGGDGYEEELRQEAAKHATLNRRTDFKGWHRPRKQWVREQQWQYETQRLVEDLDLAGKERPLSYLTLPAPDLIDVRLLQRTCSVTTQVG